MGCIIVNTTRNNGDCIVNTYNVHCNSVINTTRATKTSVVKTSLVCSINMLKNYVRVEPKYIWLIESNQFRDIVNVYSDVEWKAE